MKEITIIGGGLAGLTLGIILRRAAVPVRVIEAGEYPRHRVCGEFISGCGLKVLRDIGLLEKMEQNGFSATKVLFRDRRSKWQTELPEAALTIPRYTLDAILARHFSSLGGCLEIKTRYTGDFARPGLVRATGRRVAVSKGDGRLLGIKVHARNLHLHADLEMHCSPNAYIGVCKLPGGEVNICGLFRSGQILRNLKTDWREFLLDHVFGDLRSALARCEFDLDSLSTVAGLSLKPFHGHAPGECGIGDSVTMIPPVTGNGMSMAFESAFLVSEAMIRYASGIISWAEALSASNDRLRKVFANRLRWSRFLQGMLFSAWGPKILLLTAKTFPESARFLLRRTRT
jgi:2-polyprenyl-6-methoxyphenol hydroxylase-like FAD-dependent oxidoreductase